MGLNRIRIFALAASDFLRRQRKEQMLLLRLNKVYATEADPAQTKLLKRVRARVRQTLQDRW